MFQRLLMLAQHSTGSPKSGGSDKEIMMTIPNNNDDLIDSRDVIDAWDKDSTDPEMLALGELIDECEDYVEDWKYGVTLIRDSYFKTYAMELAYEIGAVPENYTWPTSCIDWDQATRELQMDYTCVNFAGVEYWVR
jgi:hypothetical protein